MQALSVTERSEVAAARRRAVSLASEIGFDEQDAGRVAIVATEIGSNLVKHGRQGELLLATVQDEQTKGIELLGLDRGPGIANIAKCLADGYSTAGSPGTGLGAISRLSQTFDIYSQPGTGTAVLARLWPKAKAPRDPDGRCDIGGVAVPIPGETVCGDGWAYAKRPGGALLLGVDGLGHGPLAAEAAAEAVRVFSARQHLAPGTFMQDLHLALRPTRGAAVAVADIDFDAGQTRFVSIGNVAGALLTDDKMKKMVSDNGIVGHRIHKIRETVYPCQRNSILILHSDGLVTNWQLSGYPGLLQRAASLIAAILYRDFRRGRDDTLVIVAKRGLS